MIPGTTLTRRCHQISFQPRETWHPVFSRGTSLGRSRVDRLIEGRQVRVVLDFFWPVGAWAATKLGASVHKGWGWFYFSLGC